jgi:hypothetical protein
MQVSDFFTKKTVKIVFKIEIALKYQIEKRGE